MPPAAPRPLIIAHRGASGYLPEHTLESKALACAMGADFLEQDVVVSRDDELVVLHDVHLDRVSDVAARYPARARGDGRWYARDFTLPELRTLRLRERSREADGRVAVFPGRFPADSGDFRIVTLDEELRMIAGLIRATGRRIGIYPELKRPAWHRAEGVDAAPLLLATLARHGYREPADPVFLQCFDPAELRRIREELGCRLRLIQLIGENDWGESAADYRSMLDSEGLQAVAEYADGVGPWLRQLYRLTAEEVPRSSGVAEAAHAAGLAVHPYTFRADVAEPGHADFASMLCWFRDTLRIDGLFTDFPDLARRAMAAASD